MQQLISGALAIGYIGNRVIRRDGKVTPWAWSRNIVVDEGLNYMLNSSVGNGAQKTLFYFGLYALNASFVAGTNADNVDSNYTEIRDYTNQDADGGRSLWNQTGSTVGTLLISNDAVLCEFTCTADFTAEGGFLCSRKAHGDAAGGEILMCGNRFDAPRVLVIGDKLQTIYQLSAASAA